MNAETVGNALVVISTALIWTFVISYHLMAPWWRSGLGRIVMVSKVEFALVLSIASARVIAGADFESTWYEIVRLVVFSGVPIVFILQIVALYRYQLGQYHKRGPGKNDRTATQDRGRRADRSSGRSGRTRHLG